MKSPAGTCMGNMIFRSASHPGRLSGRLIPKIGRLNRRMIILEARGRF